MKKCCIIIASILAMIVTPGIIVMAAALEWRTGADGKQYWYEEGIKQGSYGDPKNIIDDLYGNERGREIYDPGTNGWYWLDAVYDGAKAVDKEVWMPYIYQTERSWDMNEIEQNAAASGNMAAQVKDDILNHRGKWVRYDQNGAMYKGWYSVTGRDADIYPAQAGNIYYYDPKTGLMAKGWTTIDGKQYFFDEVTGVFQYEQEAVPSGGGEAPQAYTYIGNVNSKLFHKSICPSVSKMYEKNKVYFPEGTSREQIISQGYTPCQNCNP